MVKPHFKPPAALLYGEVAGAQPGILAQSTAHAAASHDDPAMVGWYPPEGSADTDYLDEAHTIVARSRDLTRNNGYAAGANQTIQDNVVGHQLRLSSKPLYKALGWSREQAKAWASDFELQFSTWADDPLEIDAGRSLTLRALTLQALDSLFTSSDAIALPVWDPRPGTRWNTRLQMIEADRLETPPLLENDPMVRGGIRINRYGAPVAYYIRSTHPGDHLQTEAVPKYQAVPALYPWGRRRVIHLRHVGRVGQSRGKPKLASIMREFRMGSHYLRTELQSSIQNSLISAFLETALSQEAAAELFASGADGKDFGRTWKASVNEWRPTLKAGAVVPLPPGGKITSHIPGRPNAAFEAFMETVLRTIAAGIHIPYELLAKDFSKTNYSSARAALLEAWRYFLSFRRLIVDHWLNPITQLWAEEAVNAGQIVAPDFYAKRHAYTNCRWVFAGRGWVDPNKEADASGKRLKYTISNLEHEAGEQGLDWEEVLEQRADELDRMRELGIPIEGPDNPMTAPGEEPEEGVLNA